MTTYRCPYCDWIGTEPDQARYDDPEEFKRDLEKFRKEQEGHDCKLPVYRQY